MSFHKTFIFLVLAIIGNPTFAQDITPLQQLSFIEMHLFNGQFDAAEKKTSVLLENDPKNTALNLYSVLCKLGTGNISGAIQNIKTSFNIPQESMIADSSIILYGCNSRTFQLPKNDRIIIYQNKGFEFNFKTPYTNICMSEDEQAITYIDATASLNRVFYVAKINQVWNSPVEISAQIGSDGYYFPSCIGNDGKRIYFTHYDNFESDIYVSHFDGKIWSPLKKLNSFINSKHSETRAFENQDGTVLYFASNRPGGFGGMDIYFSNKTGNDWGKPVNCGARINTNLNEDYPTVCNDGKKLLFSSQGIKKGVDGYDLYICSMLSDNQWTEPINLGFPFNNSEDDFTFVPLTIPSRRIFQISNQLKNPENSILFKDDNILTISIKLENENLPEGNISVVNFSKPENTKELTINSIGTCSSNFTEGIYKINVNYPGFKQLEKYIVIPFILSKDKIQLSFTLTK